MWLFVGTVIAKPQRRNKNIGMAKAVSEGEQ